MNKKVFLIVSFILITFTISSQTSNQIPVYMELSKANWKIVSRDSEETFENGGLAMSAIDGNPFTLWHTEWKNKTPAHPHEIVIDLGKEYDIEGFLYLPREDENRNGNIKNYEFYASLDGNKFSIAATGTFNGEISEKTVVFSKCIKTRFVKLVALSEVNGKSWTSAAELGIFTSYDKKKFSPEKIKTAKGKIILPDGIDFALNKTVRIKVLNEKYNMFADFNIPQQKRLVDFEMPVLAGPKFMVQYVMNDERVFKRSFWTKQGMTSDVNMVPWIEETDDMNNIDLYIAKKCFVKGKLALPEGVKAGKGGFSFEIRLRINNYGIYDKYFINEGETNSNYEFAVPVINGRNIMQIKYVSRNAGLVRSGWWTKSGIVPFYEQSDNCNFIIDGNASEVKGINFNIPVDNSVLAYDDELKLAEKKGEEIAKALYKPGLTDFEKAIILHDYILDNVVYYNFDYIKKNKITWGECINSLIGPFLYGMAMCATYSKAMVHLGKFFGIEAVTTANSFHEWNVVMINGRKYHVDLTFDDNSFSPYIYFLTSFIQSEKHVAHKQEKDLFGTDKPFIFMESDYVHKDILKRSDYRRIIGNIALPENEVAPQGGLTINVMGVPRFLPEGENKMFFISTSPVNDKNKTCIIDYSVESPLYTSSGYYSRGKTLSDRTQAESFDLTGNDITGIEITLLKGKQISGSISLPENEKAPKNGLDTYIRILGENSKEFYYRVLIPEGKSSANFSLSFNPADFENKFYITYKIWSNDYYNEGFYYGGLTVCYKDKAKTYSITSDKLQNINLTLIKSVSISGTVSLPDGQKAPKGGVSLLILHWVIDGNENSGYWVMIPEGQSSVPYIFLFPEPEKAKLKRNIGHTTENARYISAGFYAKDKPVLKKEEAAIIDFSAGSIKNIDLVLLKKK